MNISKTYGCYFNSGTSVELDISIDNKPIEFSDSVKCLGVHIDRQLSWKPHIAYLTNNVNKVIGTLHKVKRNLTTSALRTIYFSLIHSQLLYCQEIWGAAYPSNIEPLIVAQKKVARLIVGAPPRTHSQPILRKLEIRSLTTEIEYRRSLLAFEVIKQPQKYGIVINQDHAHSYGTRYATNNLPCNMNRTRRYGTQGIRNLLIQSYNSLPTEIKNLTYNQLSLAKTKLKHIYN
jgi:hypothetical protein